MTDGIERHTLEIKSDLLKKAQQAAVDSGLNLMTCEGWIACAIQEKLDREQESTK